MYMYISVHTGFCRLAWLIHMGTCINLFFLICSWRKNFAFRFLHISQVVWLYPWGQWLALNAVRRSALKYYDCLKGLTKSIAFEPAPKPCFLNCVCFANCSFLTAVSAELWLTVLAVHVVIMLHIMTFIVYKKG